jgi:Glycosyl transferase family 2
MHSNGTLGSSQGQKEELMNAKGDSAPCEKMPKGEASLRKSVPVFLNSFNQPTYLARMVAQLHKNGFERIVVCDNNSKSRKLLDLLETWEASSAVQVIRLGGNLGPHETFRRVLSEQQSPFIFSDPDVELPEKLSEEFLSRITEISCKYWCRKVGPALEIPSAGEVKNIVMRHIVLGEHSVADWERRFWRMQIEENVYRADLDTTFFFWNTNIKIDPRRQFNGAREKLRPRRFIKFIPRFEFTDIRVAGKGFTLRHLPWYRDDKMPEDERDFYRQEAAKWSTWVR